ncbi:MAG: acetylornithine deacetylase [Deltaproteobacteria bacterium]|nr:acetylornithine deacetylase [Deltaproteobacteria bacterium]
MNTLLSDTELLTRLVAFDTTSCNSNLPLVDFLCDYLDRPGIEIVRNESPDGDKANLVVFVGPPVEASRQGLVLSGHMDVVPAEEPEWQGDPFRLRDAEDRLIGRGSSDMKGFVALAANRAARLDPSRLRHPLVLLLTYDEELGTLGAHHFVDTWPRQRTLPRNVIIGEPTSLKVVRLHKGHLKMRIQLDGVPAHSGYPHLGHNAIEPAGRVIQALASLRRELEKERPENHHFFPQVPFVALNVARVEGGTAINIVPERCTVELGARVLPGMTSDTLVDRIRDAVETVTRGERCTVELTGDSPPMLLESEAPICRCLYRLTGQQDTVSASFATDAGWLQHLGLDCTIFGPGSIEVAHKPEEFIPKSELFQAGEMLDELIPQLCQ